MPFFEGQQYEGSGHDDLQLVQERLEVYRDKVRSAAAASLTGSNNVNVNTQASANSSSSANVSISIAQVSQQVQAISEGLISQEEKMALRLMLLDLEESRGKPKDEAHPKLQKLLQWLADKGVDVTIAVLPYIVSLLSTLV